MRLRLRLALPLLAALAAVAIPAAGWSQMRPQPRPQEARPAAPAPGAEVTERLVMTPPPGWEVAGQGAGQNSAARHMCPPGQGAESWSEMRSVQVMADPRLSPREHVQRVVDASRDNCEAYGPSPVSEGQSNGYPVATLTVTCTKGRHTGLGGLVAVKAIRGTSALYVVQRMWRGQPFQRNEAAPIPAEMLKDWSNFLRNVSLCDTDEAMRHPCPK